MVYQKEVGQKPVLFGESVYRSQNVLKVLPKMNIKDTVARYSDTIQCPGFRHFTVYIHLDSTGTPHNIHIEPQFLDIQNGQWHTYKQGLFAALFYEDGDCASGLWEVFSGDCAGREMRFKVTGVDSGNNNSDLGDSHYFTISLSVEFWN